VRICRPDGGCRDDPWATAPPAGMRRLLPEGRRRAGIAPGLADPTRRM